MMPAIATKRVLGMACREYPRFTASIIASADAAKHKAWPLPWRKGHSLEAISLARSERVGYDLGRLLARADQAVADGNFDLKNLTVDDFRDTFEKYLSTD